MKQENRLNKVFVPSKEDFRELYRLCKWRWNAKRKGMVVTGPNGNSIFLPASGYRYGNSVGSVGVSGSYWSSSYSNEAGAYILYFNPDGVVYPGENNFARYYGYSVRLVGSAPQEGLVDLGLPSGLLWGQSNIKVGEKELFTFDEAQGLVKDVVKLDFERKIGKTPARSGEVSVIVSNEKVVKCVGLENCPYKKEAQQKAASATLKNAKGRSRKHGKRI